MKINLTPMIKNDEIQIWADVFYEDVYDNKFGLSAKPASFERRALFTQDEGVGPLLTVSKEEARKFAKEILRMSKEKK